MKENFTMSRPHHVEDFVEKLMSDNFEEGDTFIFPKVTVCLSIMNVFCPYLYFIITCRTRRRLMNLPCSVQGGL